MKTIRDQFSKCFLICKTYLLSFYCTFITIVVTIYSIQKINLAKVFRSTINNGYGYAIASFITYVDSVMTW